MWLWGWWWIGNRLSIITQERCIHPWLTMVVFAGNETFSASWVFSIISVIGVQTWIGKFGWWYKGLQSLRAGNQSCHHALQLFVTLNHFVQNLVTSLSSPWTFQLASWSSKLNVQRNQWWFYLVGLSIPRKSVPQKSNCHSLTFLS